MQSEIERRISLPGQRSAWIETRSDGSKMVVGYAATFYNPRDPGTEYYLFDDCIERIAPTAFDRALKEKQRVGCWYNHDSDFEIGNTRNKTLRLKVDKIGLYYECDIPPVTNPPNLVYRIESGFVAGSSFGFITGQRGAIWSSEGKKDVRTLVDLSHLVDASPVDYPAYEATTTGIQIKGTALSDELNAKRQRQRQSIDIDMRVAEASNRYFTGTRI